MSNRSYLLPFLILLILGCTDEALQEPDYQPVDPVTRPWTRWWWQGSSVTEAGITKELVALKNAGFGGVEITPIYGVIGDEENFIPFLSGEWVQRLEFTLQEATRLGMGVDMATGTGWPFGGPWVSPENACKYVAHKIYHLNQGQSLIFMAPPIAIQYNSSSTIGTVNRFSARVPAKTVSFSNAIWPDLSLERQRPGE